MVYHGYVGAVDRVFLRRCYIFLLLFCLFFFFSVTKQHTAAAQIVNRKSQNVYYYLFLLLLCGDGLDIIRLLMRGHFIAHLLFFCAFSVFQSSMHCSSPLNVILYGSFFFSLKTIIIMLFVYRKMFVVPPSVCWEYIHIYTYIDINVAFAIAIIFVTSTKANA